MKQQLKVRIIQGVFFLVGAFFVIDRTLRVSMQVPMWEVMLNVIETVSGFFLFVLAIELPSLIKNGDK